MGGGGRYAPLLARLGRRRRGVGFMLGLDRVALLLERQGATAADESAPAERIEGGGLGAALKQARARRAEGARVRFGAGRGEPPGAPPAPPPKGSCPPAPGRASRPPGLPFP